MTFIFKLGLAIMKVNGQAKNNHVALRYSKVTSLADTLIDTFKDITYYAVVVRNKTFHQSPIYQQGGKHSSFVISLLPILA